MTHHIEDEVVGENRVAFTEACEYPDGARVLAATTLEPQDSKIVRQVNVEAWDEQTRGERLTRNSGSLTVIQRRNTL